ncbi:MAG: hypothetical protein ACJ8G2_18175, partial [Burkholderiales bacterium]
MTEPDQSTISICSFEGTQLPPGERLQMELGSDGNQHYTTLIGFVPGHSVLVRTPLIQNLPIPVPEGAHVLL